MSSLHQAYRRQRQSELLPAVGFVSALNFITTASSCKPTLRFIGLWLISLQNYTQNIDTLETKAGVQNVLQCHGSFATASCLECRRKVPGTAIESEIMKKKVPLCPECNPSTLSPKKKKKTSKKKAKGQWDSDVSDESDGPEYPPGIMKVCNFVFTLVPHIESAYQPDITFFGEKLSDQFDHAVEADRTQLDLLLVIGTSLKVSPVADLLCVPSILHRSR